MIKLESEIKTRALAKIFSEHVLSGDVIGLTGNLGVGKSFFARSFIHARCGIIEVPSPTFTLVQTYDDLSSCNETQSNIWHFDLYRLNNESEAHEIGLYEAIGREIVLIEWPEKLSKYSMGDWLNIDLTFTNNADERFVQMTGYGPRSQKLKSEVIVEAKRL